MKKSKKRVYNIIFILIIAAGIFILLFLSTACGKNTKDDANEYITEETPEISATVTEISTAEFLTASDVLTDSVELTELADLIELTDLIDETSQIMTETDNIVEEIPPQTQTPQNENENETVYDRNLRNYNSQGTDKVTLDYYRLTSYEIQSGDKEIVDLALSVTDGITNDYDKAKAVYMWVAGNIYQDLDYKNGNMEVKLRLLKENPPDALNTLKTKIGMCVHYTNLTAALLRAIGFPVKIIKLAEDGHELCEVYIDNRWIIMDSYFDSNNKYQNGRIIQTAACGSRFFDMTVQNIWERREWYQKQHLDFSNYVEINYFYYNTNLETLIIPDGFYSIGDVAFGGCSNLVNLYMPESIASIGVNVFSGCSSKLTIHSKAGSYAEKYAKENNINFIAETGGSAATTVEESVNSENINNDNDRNKNSDRNTFIFIFNGAEIHLDDYLDDILTDLGAPAEFYEYQSCSFEGMAKIYSYDGFNIETYLKNKSDKDRVYSIELYSGNISTAEGVSIGQKFDDMVSVYGKDYQENQGFAQRYTYTKGGTTLTFSIENGIIISIVYNISSVYK